MSESLPPDGKVLRDNQEGPDPVNFVKFVMSDVYALLDYLSGRGLIPLAFSSSSGSSSALHSGGAGVTTEAPAPVVPTCETIERDLASQNLLVCRAMRIGQELDKGQSPCHADVAFLTRARDQLNDWAKPATGSSICFTSRVEQKLVEREDKSGGGYPDGYMISDACSDAAASNLAKFIAKYQKCLWRLLIFTLFLSTYVAFG